MTLITESGALADVCLRLSRERYITVDTEFMREKTYWPQLCLLQMGGTDEAVAVDVLADGIDLTPVYDLLANPGILKVFHAARQDIEIFYHRMDAVPAPLFDTQIAAMVCGFGDSVAYDTLVSKLTKQHIDKSSRFTDWAHRPLTDRQVKYAIADVTHLRTVYEKLAQKLERSQRSDWLGSEMTVLANPETYRLDPESAWRRIKIRAAKPRMLAILKEVTAWREQEAQTRDLPRNRILRDEALLDIAAHSPRSAKDLGRTRGLARGLAEGRQGKALLDAVARGLEIPDDQCPRLPKRPDLPDGLGPVIDLLKVLLKMKCEAHGVAQKLVANSADLELIAADDNADVRALSGWRRELFGEDALAIKHGRTGLTIAGRKLQLVELPIDNSDAGTSN